MRPRVFALVAALCVSGCGDDDQAASAPHADAGSGGGGQGPGILPWACAPGEVVEADGTCTPAGIGPDGCGEGFEHDGADACAAILPDAPCAPGTFAIPGETSCHAVAPCGAGTWGDIAVDATTVFVDASATGQGDGSQAAPFATIAEALDVAPSDAVVAIAAGTYAEALVVPRPLVLWGVCPDLVSIVAPQDATAIEIGFGASGSVVRSVAVGGGFGIELYGASDVLLDRVRVHDTANEAIGASVSGSKLSRLVLRDSLVENTRASGVIGWGAEIGIERSVVRDVAPDDAGDYGRAVEISTGSASAASSLHVTRSLVERAAGVGILAFGVAVDIESSVVRDVVDGAPTGQTWRPCLHAAVDPNDDAAPALSVVASVLERCTIVGVDAAGGTLSLDRTVVRDVLGPQATVGLRVEDTAASCELSHSVVTGTAGIGVDTRGATCAMEGLVVRDIARWGDGGFLNAGIAVEDVGGPQLPEATIRGSRIENVSYRGVVVRGATATLEGVAVRGVADIDGLTAIGVELAVDWDAKPPRGSTATLRACDVGDVRGFGVSVGGSAATLDSTRIHDSVDPGDLALCGGLLVITGDVELPATAALTHCLIEQVQGLGIEIAQGQVTLDESVVRAATPDSHLGYGDAISLLTLADLPNIASVAVTDSRLESTARAGISSFGGHVVIGSTEMECNPIDLDGETSHLGTYDGGVAAVPAEAKFEDRGGNRCGCSGETWDCAVRSMKLEPPGLQ